MGLPSRLIMLLATFAASVASAEPIAIRNVAVIDGTGAPPQPGQTVLVDGGLIVDLFDTGSRPLPDGTRVVDMSGHSLLPGLIDAHVHLSRVDDRERRLRELLESGVTRVRDLAGDARIVGALARRAASGEIASPAIHYSAVMFGPGFLEDERSRTSAEGQAPGSAPWSRVVTSDSDVGRIVADARATGATGLKLYASLGPDLVSSLTREAHRQGLRVWAHSAIFPTGAGQAVRAGVDSVIHAKGLITEGRQDVPDTFAEGTRVWMRARDFAGTDPAASPFAELYGEMVQRGTILEPALMADGDRATRRLPSWQAAMRDWACRATAAAHRAGVAIGAGTDGGGERGELQYELRRLVECGLGPLDAIRAATLNNARAIGIGATHGTIAPGSVADLIVVAGNPANDIATLSNVRLVMQNGRIVGPQAPGPAGE